MSSRSLYDEDILRWSEQQAALIRDLGRTRPDLVSEVDVENIAEEIECVGRRELASAGARPAKATSRRRWGPPPRW